MSALAVLVGSSPVPQTSVDDEDYFGGIYVGDLNSKEEEEEVKEDDEDYFGGVYVGDLNGKEER